MPKMHELIAVTTGKKGEVDGEITKLYHVLQKSDLFDGINKSYRPRDEENGETLPPEEKRPQYKVTDLVAKARSLWEPHMDLILTVDAGNQVAKGDVVVDNTTLASDVPVPTLLFLEKQLENVEAFVDKIPVPDPAESWTPDASTGTLRAAATETHRTKRVQKPIVLYPATAEHPAQTQLTQEDEVVGYWRTIKSTNRMPATEKEEMLKRVRKLKDAVRVAREQANAVEVQKKTIGPRLLGYVFGS